MEIKVEQGDINKRLDTLFDNFSRSKIASAIEKGIIKVNNKIQKPSYKLKKDDIIIYDEDELYNFINPSDELIPYNFELDIKYEDDDILIINKPKEILVHPTKHERLKTISNALIFRYGKNNLSNLSGLDRLGIVHRLDKNTAGLMIACKNNISHKIISEQIKNKTLKRKYKAIALGEFEENEGIIDKPLVHYLKEDVKMMVSSDGLEAVTKYRVLEQFKGAALIELELKTGRTHQIRAHLSSINHPVFGDSLYGAKSFMRNEFYNLKTVEQLLQSYYISFIHPSSGKNMEFQLKEEEYSLDFIKVLNFLRRINNANRNN